MKLYAPPGLWLNDPNVRYTYHLTSDHPLRWDHAAKPEPLIGGPDGLEYSGCLVKTGSRCDLVHLCYEWLARHPDHPRVRGRISQTLRFRRLGGLPTAPSSVAQPAEMGSSGSDARTMSRFQRA